MGGRGWRTPGRRLARGLGLGHPVGRRGLWYMQRRRLSQQPGQEIPWRRHVFELASLSPDALPWVEPPVLGGAVLQVQWLTPRPLGLCCPGRTQSPALLCLLGIPRPLSHTGLAQRLPEVRGGPGRGGVSAVCV